jgi:hypothetical protein
VLGAVVAGLSLVYFSEAVEFTGFVSDTVEEGAFITLVSGLGTVLVV